MISDSLQETGGEDQTPPSLPLIALVGRPNVGKSSLFNRLTRSRSALVDDTPGLTRDRQYGTAALGGYRFRVVDTGGFEAETVESVAAAMREQTLVAIEEAEAIVFVTDAQSGPLADDWVVAELLRRSGKPLVCAINKAEGRGGQEMALEFHRLGLHPLVNISATHSLGLDALIGQLFAQLDSQESIDPAREVAEAAGEADEVRVAVVGCPNAGKSTLINRMVGAARLVVSDQPGTTRDAIDLPVEVEGRRFVLVDTAGIRKKSRIALRIEKYSVLAAIRAMDRAQVAILLLDAARGITDQDRRIANLAAEAGCGLILAVNKWDVVATGGEATSDGRRYASGSRDRGGADRKKFLEDVEDAFPQFTHAPVLFLSAKTGMGIKPLLPTALKVWESNRLRISTGALNRWLLEVTAQHPPPRQGGRVVKIRYATQVSINPPTFVLFTNREVEVHETYRRYLENQLRTHFKFIGVTLRIIFRASSGENPYAPAPGWVETKHRGSSSS
ncbi:MAG: ribosome biogenesis GTPase Der [Magnetococcales bacterium]|nr:ribosome biogenesis GTPase Der [Magnetococcales bacterium]